MLQILDGQPVLNDLNSFVGTIGQCATECVRFLQSIFHNELVSSPENILSNNGIPFITGVYADALAWVRGKFLNQPTEQDYSIRADTNNKGQSIFSLYGQETTPFAGPLISVPDEKQALDYRNLHIILRRKYRQDEQAKSLAQMIMQAELLRTRLLKILSSIDTTFDK